MRVPLQALAVAVATGWLAAGCHAVERESRTVTRSVELDRAESVGVELKMGAGELTVGGGAGRLLDASFQFNVPEWEPLLDYQPGASRATLRISQPSATAAFGNTENRWDLRLNDRVPMDLSANLGAGKATMTVGTLDLRSLEIHQGVGELRLDLRGEPRHSYDVRVNGGVGSAHIMVPRSVAVIARARGGIGDVRVEGLEKRGDEWYNPAHADDATAIHIDVKGGVGEIVISAEEG
jgi:hypothetical protein